MMLIREAVHCRISELRRDKGIKVKELAKRADVSANTIYGFAYCVPSTPSLAVVSGICKGLGVTLSEFFDSPLFDEKEKSPDTAATVTSEKA